MPKIKKEKSVLENILAGVITCGIIIGSVVLIRHLEKRYENNKEEKKKLHCEWIKEVYYGNQPVGGFGDWSDKDLNDARIQYRRLLRSQQEKYP